MRFNKTEKNRLNKKFPVSFTINCVVKKSDDKNRRKRFQKNRRKGSKNIEAVYESTEKMMVEQQLVEAEETESSDVEDDSRIVTKQSDNHYYQFELVLNDGEFEPRDKQRVKTILNSLNLKQDVRISNNTVKFYVSTKVVFPVFKRKENKSKEFLGTEVEDVTLNDKRALNLLLLSLSRNIVLNGRNKTFSIDKWKENFVIKEIEPVSIKTIGDEILEDNMLSFQIETEGNKFLKDQLILSLGHSNESHRMSMTLEGFIVFHDRLKEYHEVGLIVMDESFDRLREIVSSANKETEKEELRATKDLFGDLGLDFSKGKKVMVMKVMAIK